MYQQTDLPTELCAHTLTHTMIGLWAHQYTDTSVDWHTGLSAHQAEFVDTLIHEHTALMGTPLWSMSL